MSPVSSPRRSARITGTVYLLYFLVAVAGGLMTKGIVANDDADITARNILAHGDTFRLGITTGIIATAIYIALIARFFDLFKPVNPRLSLLAAFFSLVGCAVQAFGCLFQMAPFLLTDGSKYLDAFNTEQMHAIALLFLKLHTLSSGIELVFFGLYDIFIGYLIFGSAFLPRILGVLMICAGFSWLTFLWPAFAIHLSPYIQIIGFIAEVSLMVWLLVKGINVAK